MITPEYCRVMARYNTWQNTAIRKIVTDMPAGELTQDRGAFFGSILGTLNHILCADQRWIARLSGAAVPPMPEGGSTALTPSIHVWTAERFRMDGQITQWAEALRAVDLLGDLVWNKDAAGNRKSAPVGVCVTHFFNHQTHHRGQVHAMLTAAGKTTEDTDLVLMS